MLDEVTERQRAAGHHRNEQRRDQSEVVRRQGAQPAAQPEDREGAIPERHVHPQRLAGQQPATEDEEQVHRQVTKGRDSGGDRVLRQHGQRPEVVAVI